MSLTFVFRLLKKHWITKSGRNYLGWRFHISQRIYLIQSLPGMYDLELQLNLSDHRAVYNARCRRPQPGQGVSHMRTKAGRQGVGIFVDVLYGQPLTDL